MKIDVVIEVSKRKYDIDKKGLQECLRSHRKPLSEIAEKLNVPKTMVEHWFRTDKYFAVPDADIWERLKEYLKIVTDEFDKQIMTYEVGGGTYDIRNRIYCGAIAPTITANSGDYLYLL